MIFIHVIELLFMISSLAKKITVYNLQLFFAQAKNVMKNKNHFTKAQATNEFGIIAIIILFEFILSVYLNS